MDTLPNVVALPLEEARAVLVSAGWKCREVIVTRAPWGRGAGQAMEGASPEEFLVVRQQVLESGGIRLTVAAHPGLPSESCEVSPANGGV